MSSVTIGIYADIYLCSFILMFMQCPQDVIQTFLFQYLQILAKHMQSQ